MPQKKHHVLDFHVLVGVKDVLPQRDRQASRSISLIELECVASNQLPRRGVW